MSWFNVLCNDLRFAEAKENLVSKLGNPIKHEKLSNGCITVLAFNDDTRLCLDKRFASAPDSIILPKRFMPYHAALLKHGKNIPKKEPPRLPLKWRKVTAKRHIDEHVEKVATWVASHLCHNKRCINPEHIEWEPNWFNRMRDNCAGGDDCRHLPFKCLQGHRSEETYYDWSSIDA